MLDYIPVKSEQALIKLARMVWFSLSEKDWLEGFASHPKIGDLDSIRKKFSSTAAWSNSEQAGVNVASDDVIKGLAQGNSEYEKKFGFIFIVCASGKSAGEMLAILNERLKNERIVELKIAAEEHAKITALRLSKSCID